jgi:hypoxanthine phosphoribosyltransferase
MADLSRAIEIAHELDFIAVSSFGPGSAQHGAVRMLKDLDRSIEGRDVLLVEDVIDTGLTLAYILRVLRTRRPRSLSVGTLLNKPARRFVEIPLQYRGFEAPDAFYVGYGLDLMQRYRNLPFIAVPRPEAVTRLLGSPVA